MISAKRMLNAILLSTLITLAGCATSQKTPPIAPTLNASYQGDLVIMTIDDAGKLAEYIEALRFECTQ